MQPSLEGKTKIEGFEKYYIDRNGNVFALIQAGVSCYVKQLQVYTSEVNNKPYVILMKGLETRKNRVRDYNFIDDLMLQTFGDKMKKRVIKYNSGEGRVKLDRIRFLQHITRFHPNVHIHLTASKNGVYETSADLKQMGVSICESCGHPNAVEHNRCMECNEWLFSQ